MTGPDGHLRPMPRAQAIGYALGLPLATALLIFVPAGRLAWPTGWAFLVVMLVASLACILVMARVNPVIFRARSRVQPGTRSWDRALLALLTIPGLAVLPVAAFDAGRLGHEAGRGFVVAGYALFLAGMALMTWAQAVNRFFEPGVRIQADRGHHVVDSGPYAVVRHPGYVSAFALFAGMALSLSSFWALVPATLACAVLVLRTSWEDELLQAELAGYAAYARRVRWRLVPGLW